jgi:putative glycosyltransferase (TIGR04348 family)
MKITLVTPAPPHSRHGNRNTAARWAGLLRELGHRVALQVIWDGAPADLMIALHARRSADSVARFRAAWPARPVVLVLTGTDLYRDIRMDAGARRSLALADRLVVLQDMGLRELSSVERRKARVIYQSARIVKPRPPLTSCFEVVVSGHLREEKDPFRTAAALRSVPPASRIRVTHIGGAMTVAMASEARTWMALEPRYRWRGERPHGEALRILARSRLMVISSRMEGGANVVGEALAAGIPIVASRISGNIGMLGHDYAGYFTVENEHALARLLLKAENDPAFLQLLRRQGARRRRLVQRDREMNALARVIAEVASAFRARPRRAPRH